MDVYENAKSFRKDHIKQQSPNGINRKQSNNQNERLSQHVQFDKETINVKRENTKGRQKRHFKIDSFQNNYPITINAIHENEIEMFSLSDTGLITDTIATKTAAIAATINTTTTNTNTVNTLKFTSMATSPITDPIQRNKRMVRYICF